MPLDEFLTPELAYIRLTTRCNARCCMCSFWQKPIRAIGTHTVSRLMKDLKAHGIKEIRFTGGEPSLHPNFIDILRLSVDLGLSVSVVSNGTILCVDTLAELSSNEDWKLFLSIDSHSSELNMKIRGFDILEKLATRSFDKKFSERIILNVILSKLNKHIIPFFPEWMVHQGFKRINIIPMKTREYMLSQENLLLLTGDLLRECKKNEITHYIESSHVDLNAEYAAELLRRPYADLCYLALRVLFIDVDGSVFSCNSSSYRMESLCFGNVYQKSIKSIIGNASTYFTMAKREISEKTTCDGFCDFSNRLLNRLIALNFSDTNR